jgi:Bacterial regulatory proteins, luxR family
MMSDQIIKRLKAMGIRWGLSSNDASRGADPVATLKERIKELNCLYVVSQVCDLDTIPVNTALSVVADTLPPSMQYPEICCASIECQGFRHESRSFQGSPWKLTTSILIKGREEGEIVVYYQEERPSADVGPFLREEAMLLTAVAERIGKYVERRTTRAKLREVNRTLETERRALEEANTALRGVLSQIEIEKQEMRLGINENVGQILMPTLHKLATELPPQQRAIVDLLRVNLENITSPFQRQLGNRFSMLTPTEMQICEMIRNGYGSKEIAVHRRVSTATISRHRENIRRKLGLVNMKVNLTNYIKTEF